MKLNNLDRIIIDQEGKDFTDGTTLRKVLVSAALSMGSEPDKKYRLGTLGVMLQTANRNVELASEDVVLLKDRVGRMFGPIVMVRVVDALEQRKPAEARIQNEIDQDEETM